MYISPWTEKQPSTHLLWVCWRKKDDHVIHVARFDHSKIWLFQRACITKSSIDITSLVTQLGSCLHTNMWKKLSNIEMDVLDKKICEYCQVLNLGRDKFLISSFPGISVKCLGWLLPVWWRHPATPRVYRICFIWRFPWQLWLGLLSDLPGICRNSLHLHDSIPARSDCNGEESCHTRYPQFKFW